MLDLQEKPKLCSYKPIDGKYILLTGGTGTFGQAFVKTILGNYEPALIRIFSRGEYLQWKTQGEFNDPRLDFFIGDIRDISSIKKAMQGIDIVVHAAALKQADLSESCPDEFIKTNVLGAINLIDVATESFVDRVIAISSDKACAPNNAYGATKMLMEKLFIAANLRNVARFSCVRYGNVIGSRGSLTERYQKESKKGLIHILDENITKFWWSVYDGVKFFIKCLEIMEGGEIFVPKMKSRRLLDVIDEIDSTSPRKIVGLRPGDKLHEELISPSEALHSMDLGDYYVIRPQLPIVLKNIGKPLPKDFRYTSEI